MCGVLESEHDSVSLLVLRSYNSCLNKLPCLPFLQGGELVQSHLRKSQPAFLMVVVINSLLSWSTWTKLGLLILKYHSCFPNTKWFIRTPRNTAVCLCWHLLCGSFNQNMLNTKSTDLEIRSLWGMSGQALGQLPFCVNWQDVRAKQLCFSAHPWDRFMGLEK